MHGGQTLPCLPCARGAGDKIRQCTHMFVLRALQTTFMARLLRTPLVSLAAIRGACPAGGCCMSLACDMRIMTESGHIGLNEVAHPGLPHPF